MDSPVAQGPAPAVKTEMVAVQQQQPEGVQQQQQRPEHHHNPPTSSAPNWRVMKTARGGFRVIVDGHMFVDQKVMRHPDHIRFTCAERKPQHCRCAVIMTKNHRNFVKQDQSHNHQPPDPSVFGELYDIDQPLPRKTPRSRKSTDNTESDRARIKSESMDFEEEEEHEEEMDGDSPGPSESIPTASDPHPILSDDLVTLIFHQMTQEERIRAKSVSRYFNHISKQFLPTPNFKLNAELFISPTKRGPQRYTFKAYNEQRCFNGLFPNRPESWPSFLRIVSLNISTMPTDGRGAINPDDVNVICTMLKHRAMWGISTLSIFNVDLIHVNFELSETLFAHLMRAKILKLTKVVNICEDFGYLLEHLSIHSKRLQCLEMINCTLTEPQPFDYDLITKCLRRKSPVQMDLSSFELECGTQELIDMMLDLTSRDPHFGSYHEEDRSVIICPHRRINLAEVAQKLGTSFEDDSFIVALATDHFIYVVKVSIITESQLRFSARYATKQEFSEYLSPMKPPHSFAE